MRSLPLALLLAVGPAGSAWSLQSPDSAVVTPGARYRASGLHRFLFGRTHRDLWATPIRVPVLDLDRFEGGLTAFARGGSKQSRSLRLGAGGRVFIFRALDKDPTQTWPPRLRQSTARRLAEDQTSSLFPTGALAVSALEEAAGLLHARLRLVLLPDHPRLLEWRAEFSGNVGLLEERLRGESDLAALPGAREIVSSDTLYQRLARSSRHQVDAPAYLTARLFDLLVGDWDRHADQWSWARFDEGKRHRWVPIPRDRDWALTRLDGPLSGLLRLYVPKYQSFGDHYGSVYGLTFSGEPLDRRLLTGLSRPTWDSAAGELQGRLTDDAIDQAVGRLPPEYQGEATRELAQALRQRRDRLPAVAARFYRQLAGAVEVRGSDGDELVVVERGADGSTTVRVTPVGDREPVYSRRFSPRETGEVRVYLRGGSDSVRFIEGGPPAIKVRVVRAPGAAPAADSAEAEISPVVIPRDWGHLWSVAPWVEAGPEVGLLVGGGPVLYRYAFRKSPYQSRLALRFGYATGAARSNLDLNGDFRFQRPDVRLTLYAALLGADLVRYYGLGNETVVQGEGSFHHLVAREVVLQPALEWEVARHTVLGVGALAKTLTTDLDREDLLALERPYGSGSFTEAGAQLLARYDSRDDPVYPTRGLRLSATAQYSPALFDVEESFGSLSGVASAFATARGLPATPTLALRAGGTRVWGRYPFFEAAFVGGRRSLRGFNSHRFLGDASVYGGAELRLALGSYSLVLPGRWGIYALGDAGRVYLEGEDSSRWHTAAGGGLWFAFLDRRSTLTFTLARSPERTRFYAQAGFHY